MTGLLGDLCVIIRRYIGTQVLATTLAVAGLLTVILMSGRLIQFFERAASGRIAVDLLASVMLYRMPGFLELILPLGLFVGLLLGLGRLYLDNEMAVLAAAGMGPAHLIRWLVPVTVLVTVATAALAIWLTPLGYAESERLKAEQAERSTFELIQPGRFQPVGDRMLYADLSDDKSLLRDIMILETRPGRDGGESRQVLLQAEQGRRVNDPVLGPQAVELVNGQRWELRPGDAEVQRMRFDSYRMRLKQVDLTDTPVDSVRALASGVLLAQRHGDPKAAAEWGWRWSLVLLVPVVSLLALPLAKVNPRQGRYLKLLPAIVLYLSYVVLLIAVRNGVEKEDVGAWGFMAVHVLYLALALVLLLWTPRRKVPA